MLSVLQDAQHREAAAAAESPWQRVASVSWVQGDALELPFSDASFDAVTMGYGLRNVADIPRALGELRRVLVPGGRAAVLDFNNSSQPLIDGLQVRQPLCHQADPAPVCISPANVELRSPGCGGQLMRNRVAAHYSQGGDV